MFLYIFNIFISNKKQCYYKIIGLFGFVSEYKGHETAIRALKLLPAEYKIIIFGSQHPMSIMQNTKVDPYIDQLIQIITEDTEYDKDKI